MPFNKASLHGPNRAANLKSAKHWEATPARQEYPPQGADSGSGHPSADCILTERPVLLPTNPSAHSVRVKSLNGLREEFPEISLQESHGHVGLIRKNNGKATEELLKQHCRLTGVGRGKSSSAIATDPLLIHFHDIPVYILRVVFLEDTLFDDSSKKTHESDIDWIYLSDVQLYNHKICEDTIMSVTCCSRLPEGELYDTLSVVGVEVFSADPQLNTDSLELDSKDISRELMNSSYQSVLTVNELVIIHIDKTKIGCRIYGVKTDPSEQYQVTAAELAMEDPYRGKVEIHTQFVSYASDDKCSITVLGAQRLPSEMSSPDVIHVTTSDGEWFPVNRILLATCLKLTQYVQSGKGKYQNVPSLPIAERSVDAPDDGCPHCKVDIDCCTFDRVLIFIISMLYPDERTFTLGIDEGNSLADAANHLGLRPLADLCEQMTSSFESRVRRDRYIRFSEIQCWNNSGKQIILILDGMVLDITQWLDEHPGGAFIIPAQALNVDCTVFFEMYHVSRQSFLYLKQFYIGELDPDDRISLKSSADGVSASDGFLQLLRKYTVGWRIRIDNHDVSHVHKSF